MGGRKITGHGGHAARATAETYQCPVDEANWFRLFVLLLIALLFCGRLHPQAGPIRTIAGPQASGAIEGLYPAGIAVDSSGGSPILYTADPQNCVVWKTQAGATGVFAGVQATQTFSCGGGAATAVPTTTPMPFPVAVATCGGNVFIAAQGRDAIPLGGTETAGAIYEVDSSGTLSVLPLPTVSASGAGPLHPVAATCDSKGNLYLSSYFYAVAGLYGQVDELSPKQGETGWNSTNLVSGDFHQTYTSLTVDPNSGDLFGLLIGVVGEGWLDPGQLGQGAIEDITQHSTHGVESGDSFANPSALIMDANSNFIFAKAAQADAFTSNVDLLAFNGAGANAAVVAGTGTPGYSGDGGISTSAQVSGVSGLALDSSGNLYLADTNNSRVRTIHLLAPGPSALTLANTVVPVSAGAGPGQAAINTSNGDFYYVSGTNTVNIINHLLTSTAGIVSTTLNRIVDSIPVGASGAGTIAALKLIADPTRNLIYAYNSTDGRLYAIDGSYGTSTSHTVVGSVALNNANVTLLAIDTALNELYAGGPNSSSVSAVRGGASPKLIGNASAPFVSSISVDAATHTVYAVALTGAGTGQEPGFITMTPAPSTAQSPGELTVNESVFPGLGSNPAEFIGNSIAADALSGTVITAGAPSFDFSPALAHGVYDIIPQRNETVSAYFSWPPISASLDEGNRVFYVTDFDGSSFDPSSNAAMVTGIDKGSLSSVVIPVFGTGAVPSSPHVYDVEPDSSTFQAWISGSDATDGGFVKVWDSASQKIALSVAIPGNGGGPLFVDTGSHAAFLVDEVNHLLRLINEPPLSLVPAPTLTQSQDGKSVTIAASQSGDSVYYTLNGTPPGLDSNLCVSPCTVNLTQGDVTAVNAIEVHLSAGTEYPSNDVQGSFTVTSPTTTALTLSANPVGTSGNDQATATITPSTGVLSVTGTVTFTATAAGSSTAVTLCSAVSVASVSGKWQAICSFSEASGGTYTITASYSGDELNKPSSNTASLTVIPGLTPVLATVSGGGTTAIAINSNTVAGLSFNAVLNADSSVSLLSDGAILSGQGCPAFTGISGGLSGGAVFIDFANLRIYLTMLTGSAVYAAYESIDLQGKCTQGPLLKLNSTPEFTLELNVDTAQSNVYVLQASNGGVSDTLSILPTAPWSASSLPTPASVNLDYSAQYGPILIDPSNHLVYINDLGASASGSSGTYSTAGFFVYDPNHDPASPAKNLQQVAGYLGSGGGKATAFNVGTLLNDGAGKLILVNENPSASTANLTVPITILDTKQKGFSFFTNTQPASNFGSAVNITPGSALSTISAAAQYSAIGAADLDAANEVVYAFGFDANAITQPGMLLQYNLSASASSQEKVLSQSVAMPRLYDTKGPWSQMNYNPTSTEVVLWAYSFGSGSLGATSPLCAGDSPAFTQLFGDGSSGKPLDAPVVNAASGYVYAVQPKGFGTPAQSPAIDFIAPPSGVCSTSTGIKIAPAALPAGIAGGAYSQTLTATGGSGTGYTWKVSSGTALSATGLQLSSAGAVYGTPTSTETNAPVTVKVTDSKGNTASKTYQLTIYPALSIAPARLPAGVVGTAYSATLTASGGAGGGYSWSISAGATSLTSLGLNLSSAGKITGTPSASGNASFTVRVADSQGNAATQSYQLIIGKGSPGSVTVTDNETITVLADSPEEVQLIDVNDTNETISVVDTVSVKAAAASTRPAMGASGQTVQLSDGPP